MKTRLKSTIVLHADFESHREPGFHLLLELDHLLDVCRGWFEVRVRQLLVGDPVRTERRDGIPRRADTCAVRTVAARTAPRSRARSSHQDHGGDHRYRPHDILSDAAYDDAAGAQLLHFHRTVRSRRPSRGFRQPYSDSTLPVRPVTRVWTQRSTFAAGHRSAGAGAAGSETTSGGTGEAEPGPMTASVNADGKLSR